MTHRSFWYKQLVNLKNEQQQLSKQLWTVVPHPDDVIGQQAEACLRCARNTESIGCYLSPIPRLRNKVCNIKFLKIYESFGHSGGPSFDPCVYLTSKCAKYVCEKFWTRVIYRFFKFHYYTLSYSARMPRSLMKRFRSLIHVILT